jgi:uncharacterized protein (DUF608 family)
MESNECCPGGQCEPIARRDFLRLTALTTLGVAGGPVLAQAKRLAKYVPVEKGVVPDLAAKGERAVYRGDELRTIGMPIGGICAGQVYLGGDGRLWLWDIFNQIKFGSVQQKVEYAGNTWDAGGGANYIKSPDQVHPFAQGFSVKVGDSVRPLDTSGWKEVTFAGEYPMGFVEYRDPASPVTVSLEAYSPFEPLDADTSGTPAVVLRYTLKNTSSAAVKAQIGGWMENPVGLHSLKGGGGTRENVAVKDGVEFRLLEPPRVTDARPPILFEDWTANGFGTWTVTGDAFGKGAYDRDKIPGINFLGGGPGNRVVKSYRIEGEGNTNIQGDELTGRLVSREFTIERRYIEFWTNGGNHPKTAYIGLLVDGKLVRSETGRQEDELRLERFDVSEFEGKRARIEIVDAEKGFWGQIGVGQIAFVDQPTFALEDAPDFGEMALAILDAPAWVNVDLQPDLFERDGATGSKTATSMATPLRPKSGVVSDMDLAPGESKTVTFVIAWRFPNLTISKLGKVGNHYAERFASVGAVIDALRKDDGYATTKKWHATWYDSSLPRWFLDRTMASASIMASMTCVRFASGRFYGWEGIGCCDGTCGHVWQYAHAVGRLFPSLERSIREMVDYKPGAGFHEDTGLIDFRGEYGLGFAADAQSGYILRTYREHQTSPNADFLKRVYPRMKKALDYIVRQDADDDGILEGRQHNTLDVDLYGPSSWLTSLYLAALRAGEEMAKEMGDTTTAKRWRAIFDRGASRFDQVFWNGSYYIHRLNLEEHPDSMRIGNGCEGDQLMGQQWAHQVGLGRVVGEKNTKAALKALYRNNFLPDITSIRKVDARGRWYGMPGESGLLMCSFPQGDRTQILGEKPTWASMYFNEVWTGQEYQVASHMIQEGLTEEGLRIVKAVHDRHHPAKRNPWNEVECSDHYARAMASYGVFTAASGFEIHGPKGHLGFAPKIGADDFRAAFTGAEGWGTYRQKIGKDMEAGLLVRHGSVRLKTLSLEIPLMLKGMVRVTMNGRAVPTTASRQGEKTTLTFANELRLKEGDELVVHVSK